MTEHSTLTPRPAAGPTTLTPEPRVRLSSARRDRLRKRLARRMAAWAGILLLGYWLAAFTLTHIPLKGTGGPFLGIPNADKLVHLVLYTGLSLLMSVWFGVRKKIGGALVVAGVVLLALAVYATIDELSQIPVGRNADIRDWFADLAGIHLGLFGFFALRSWVRR